MATCNYLWLGHETFTFHTCNCIHPDPVPTRRTCCELELYSQNHCNYPHSTQISSHYTTQGKLFLSLTHTLSLSSLSPLVGFINLLIPTQTQILGHTALGQTISFCSFTLPSLSIDGRTCLMFPKQLSPLIWAWIMSPY